MLGSQWKAAEKPFEPAPPRPSDCPEFDRLEADRRTLAMTQRSYMVDGELIYEINAKAPEAAQITAFLDRQSSFMLRRPTVRYPTGGITRIMPASSRANQRMYVLRHDEFKAQRTILTIKGPWLIEVTAFGEATAPPPLVDTISSTLSKQALP